MQCILARIKTQVENHQMSDSGFTLDQIMGLLINIYKLGLIRAISDTELPECIAKKKAVTDPKITMNSTLNGYLLQHSIMKRLSIILEELASFNIMKIKMIGIGFSFR